MEIIIKLDHDDLGKVKTFSTKNRERDQFIRTIKYRGDQIHHFKTRQDELLMNLQNKNDELQDLKLENDRLKKRDDIMLKFVKSAYCRGLSCFDCLFFDDTQTPGSRCVYNRNEIYSDISEAANKILQELDNL